MRNNLYSEMAAGRKLTIRLDCNAGKLHLLSAGAQVASLTNLGRGKTWRPLAACFDGTSVALNNNYKK